MPVHKVPGGWQWGNKGHVYSTRERAEKQAQAAYANGYKEDPNRTAMDKAIRNKMKEEQNGR